MHPSLLSKYMFNILFVVMIELINYERFSTNDDENLKLLDDMRGQPLKSPTTSPCLPPRQNTTLQVYHGEVAKCCTAPSSIQKGLL
jgi:hypothetical protein